jgi:hypothetical protein
MRDRLPTRVIRDNSVTAFLSCWVHEEFFQSLLLRRFLTAQGMSIDDRRFAQMRTRRLIRERMVKPVASLIARVTRHFPAVHMTWGALNELSRLTGYNLLISYMARGGIDPGDGLLAQRLRRIGRTNGAISPFISPKPMRACEIPLAQRLTSFLLRRLWMPVARSVGGNAYAQRIFGRRFSDAEGRRCLGTIDLTIAKLPALGGFERATRRCTSAAAMSVRSALGGAPRLPASRHPLC